MPFRPAPLCAIDARSGSAYGSDTTSEFCADTAARSFASQAVAASRPVPGTVLSSRADSPEVPGFCTRYCLVIASTVSSRSGSIAQVRPGMVAPISTSLFSRPSPVSSPTRLSSRSTGVWSWSGMVCATSIGAWVSGHTTATGEAWAVACPWYGRKVRAMPSVWVRSSPVLPQRSTASS